MKVLIKYNPIYLCFGVQHLDQYIMPVEETSKKRSGNDVFTPKHAARKCLLSQRGKKSAGTITPLHV